MTLNEKAAYLKGLAEGLGLDTATPEGKIINALVELVGELSNEIEMINGDLDEVLDFVDDMDADLDDLEDYVYGEDDLDDDDDDYYFDDEDDDWCDGDCEDCEGCDDGEIFVDEDFNEVTCPICKHEFYIEKTMDATDITCPNCKERFDASED